MRFQVAGFWLCRLSVFYIPYTYISMWTDLPAVGTTIFAAFVVAMGEDGIWSCLKDNFLQRSQKVKMNPPIRWVAFCWFGDF